MHMLAKLAHRLCVISPVPSPVPLLALLLLLRPRISCRISSWLSERIKCAFTTSTAEMASI